MARQRLTVKLGPGTTINGLPVQSRFWRGEQIIVSGEFDFEVEDLEHYVQIRFPGTSYLYTYRDPSGTLQVGDLVQVPFVNSYANGIGSVDALGRGNWEGETKDIVAKLERKVLA